MRSIVALKEETVEICLTAFSPTTKALSQSNVVLVLYSTTSELSVGISHRGNNAIFKPYYQLLLGKVEKYLGEHMR